MQNIHQEIIASNNSYFNKISQLFIIIILIGNINYGQKKNNSEIYYTPNGIFDQVLDSKGNVYSLSEIIVAKPSVSKNGATTLNTLLCTSGIFELYFEAGSGMEIVGNPLEDHRRAIICQAFQDISDFINTPLKNAGNTNKLKIWIRNPDSVGLPVNAAAAAASSFYNLPTISSTNNQNQYFRGIIDNEIWKTIKTGINSYSQTVFPVVNASIEGGFYHGWASFNFAGNVNWNLDYDKYNASTNFPLNYMDFYTTIIHELTHALGFNSLMYYNGYSQFFSSINNYFGNYYTRYDRNLKTSSNLPLISNSPVIDGQMFGFSFNSNISAETLYPSCSLTPPIYYGNSGEFNCPTAIKYVSSITVPVYNPPCFENGSSLSHFEDACYNGNSNDQYFMMSERATGLYAKRALTNEERQVLCDIGYSVNGTFGNASNFTYKDYGVATCTGIMVAGVNDGLSTSSGTYAFQGNSGTDISISGILNNDYTAGLPSNLRFEYIQDLYDPTATFSVTTGMATTSFTIKSYSPGVHLLRYVPFDIATGQRGNITYIYVNVLNNCVINNPSNLVKNGNFEEHNFAPNNAGEIYKSCGWQNSSYSVSSDYYNSDATNSTLGIPSNFIGDQNDRIVGNHAYVGMFVSQHRQNLLESVYSESIKTELSNSLQANTQYQLSFDVSMAEYDLTGAIKFQAFITDSNLDLTTGGIIPISYITNDKVFLTNSTFSTSSSVNNWETINFTFITGSNPNLKYLYIGGLSNVQFHNNNNEIYYYVDNVSLTPVLSNNTFEFNTIEVFPNPSKTIVTISSSNENIEQITLCDIQGRILQTEKINNKFTHLDVSNYQTGTYLIVIKTDNGTSNRKFIKN